MRRRTSEARDRTLGERSGDPRHPEAYDVALRLVAIRNHSRLEMRQKLARRGYKPAEIDDAEARLDEVGFLNDRVVAHLYVRRRARTMGPLVISAELAAKGIDRDIADEELARFKPHMQLKTAMRLAERLCGNRRYASYRELLHSVGAKLLRRGFSMDVARAACDSVWAGPEEDSDSGV